MNILNTVSRTINGFISNRKKKKGVTYRVFVNGKPKYKRSLAAARKLAKSGRKNKRIHRKTAKGWSLVR